MSTLSTRLAQHRQTGAAVKEDWSYDPLNRAMPALIGDLNKKRN